MHGKYGGEGFHTSVPKIYETGKWPADFPQTVIIRSENKPNATECSDFRTISLLGHAAKVLIRVLTKRIEAIANVINHIWKDQFGFRKGKSSTFFRHWVATPF